MMDVDDLARRAGQDLREAVRVDVDAALDELRRVAPRRRRTSAVLVMAATTAVLLVAIGAAQLLGRNPERTVQPVDRPTGSPPAVVQGPAVGCHHPLVTCVDSRTARFDMKTPMTWTLPAGFGTPYSGTGVTARAVESYVDDGNSGVSVIEGVGRAANREAVRALPAVDDARGLVDWIAARPFLSASTVRRTEVDGRSAWTVDVDVLPGLPEGPALCNARMRCYPVLVEPNGSGGRIAGGAWEGLTSRYTAVNLPGSGVGVVWSWSLDGEIPSVADDLVDTITWN